MNQHASVKRAVALSAIALLGFHTEPAVSAAAKPQPAAHGATTQHTTSGAATGTDASKSENANTTHFSYEELETHWTKLTARQKMVALFQLVRKAKFELAQRLLNSTPFQGPAALDASFVQARIFQGTGKLKDAAAIYRKILVDHPDNQPTRVQLGHTLFLLKEDASARHHFELALGSVTNRKLETNIRNFLDQLDRRKRWNVGAYVSLAPSTNFNQGTDAQIVYLNGLPFRINESGRSKSGIGVLGGINAGYRFALTEKLDLVTGAGVNFKEYKNDTFDDWSVSAQLGPRYTFTNGHVGLFASLDRRWFADRGHSKSIGGRAQLGLRLSKNALTSLSLGCSWKRYDQADHLDGRACYGGGYLDYYLSNTMYARVLGGVYNDKTARKHLDHTAWNIGTGLYTELPWGMSIYAQGRFTKRNFDGHFPGTLTARDDKQFDLTGTLTKRDWNWMGFAPKFEYAYTRNLSNVPFYDYDAHSANITLTKNF